MTKMSVNPILLLVRIIAFDAVCQVIAGRTSGNIVLRPKRGHPQICRTPLNNASGQKTLVQYSVSSVTLLFDNWCVRKLSFRQDFSRKPVL